MPCKRCVAGQAQEAEVCTNIEIIGTEVRLQLSCSGRGTATVQFTVATRSAEQSLLSLSVLAVFDDVLLFLRPGILQR